MIWPAEANSYNTWLREQSPSLYMALRSSMSKLQVLLQELESVPLQGITMELSKISTTITKVEDLTSRLRHLGTLTEQGEML